MGRGTRATGAAAVRACVLPESEFPINASVARFGAGADDGMVPLKLFQLKSRLVMLLVKSHCGSVPMNVFSACVDVCGSNATHSDSIIINYYYQRVSCYPCIAPEDVGHPEDCWG